MSQLYYYHKKLYVQFEAALENPSAVEKTEANGSYSYATPCFLTVDKNNYTAVIFMENGKKVGAVSVSQSRQTKKRA
jgi:hypothetical protein